MSIFLYGFARQGAGAGGMTHLQLTVQPAAARSMFTQLRDSRRVDISVTTRHGGGNMKIFRYIHHHRPRDLFSIPIAVSEWRDQR